MNTAPQPKKILIVEDDTFLQSLLAQKMSSRGFALLTAKEGISALDIAKKEQPNLILLDILLPGMNGMDVLEDLKSHDDTKYISVMILSNLGQQADIDQALKLGASMYLVKANTTPDEIVKKVDELLK